MGGMGQMSIRRVSFVAWISFLFFGLSFDVQPDYGLELVRNQANFCSNRAVCLGQRIIVAEANGGGQAVRAEHPRIERDRIWIMRVPEILPEGPGFRSRFGINCYAVARGENVFGFRQV